MKEIWKDVVGYEGLYQVSNLGRVKSLERTVLGRWGKTRIKERILSEIKDKKGYVSVALYKNGENKHKKIHRLVAEAFILNPYSLPEINHKDENKTNNCVNNLEWCTTKYNCNYGTKNNPNKKSVYQYNTKNEFIKKWDSISEASKSLNISGSRIGDCCNKKKYRKTSGGYIWRFVDE